MCRTRNGSTESRLPDRCEIPGCGGRSSGMRSGKAGGKRAEVNTAVSCFCSEEIISGSRLPAISGI